MTDKEETDGLM